MIIFVFSKIIIMDISRNYHLEDKVEYIIALVNEFAKTYGLSDAQAWRYMKRYDGVRLLDEQYGFMHTQSFSDMVADMALFMNRKGGKL